MMVSLPVRLLAGAIVLATATLAHAQYVWIDAHGTRQLSDKAPPASVPLKNILKAPRGVAGAAGTAGAMGTAGPLGTASTPNAATAATTPAPAPAAPTVAERNADFHKRNKAAADREQAERDEQTGKAEQADNCARARAARQSIDSGVRIGIQDANGERGFMNEAQRALEMRRIDKILAACK